MKKLLFAAVAGLLTMGVLQAGCGWRNRCPRRRACPTRCPRRECPPAKPICYKTFQVPKTVYVDERVEVEAREIRIKNADIVREIPQDPICVKIPVTTYRYEYKPVPCKYEHIPVPDTVRYECPVDCD